MRSSTGRWIFGMKIWFKRICVILCATDEKLKMTNRSVFASILGIIHLECEFLNSHYKYHSGHFILSGKWKTIIGFVPKIGSRIQSSRIVLLLSVICHLALRLRSVHKHTSCRTQKLNRKENKNGRKQQNLIKHRSWASAHSGSRSARLHLIHSERSHCLRTDDLNIWIKLFIRTASIPLRFPFDNDSHARASYVCN